MELAKTTFYNNYRNTSSLVSIVATPRMRDSLLISLTTMCHLFSSLWCYRSRPRCNFTRFRDIWSKPGFKVRKLVIISNFIGGMFTNAYIFILKTKKLQKTRKMNLLRCLWERDHFLRISLNPFMKKSMMSWTNGNNDSPATNGMVVTILAQIKPILECFHNFKGFTTPTWCAASWNQEVIKTSFSNGLRKCKKIVLKNLKIDI